MSFKPIYKTRNLPITWEEIADDAYFLSNVGKHCRNPNAIPFLRKHWNNIQHEIIWYKLCANTAVIPLLDEHWDFIQHNIIWCSLCHNPSAIPLLDKHWDDVRTKINWAALCDNTSAIPLLEKRWCKYVMHRINWWFLCSNISACDFIESKWSEFKRVIENNQFVIKTTRSNWEMDKNYWIEVYNSINFYQRNNRWCNFHSHDLHPSHDLICWAEILHNPNAFCLVRNHLNEIPTYNRYIERYLKAFSTRFKLDTAAMRAQARPFAEELAAKVFHPKRMAIWSAWEKDDDMLDEE